MGVTVETKTKRMPARTRKALEASIKHWEENVEAKTPVFASTAEDACALCNLFIKLGCGGCPVSDKTGEIGCCGSPYRRADLALKKWRLHEKTTALRSEWLRSEWRRAARKELAFLKSLLPASP